MPNAPAAKSFGRLVSRIVSQSRRAAAAPAAVYPSVGRLMGLQGSRDVERWSGAIHPVSRLGWYRNHRPWRAMCPRGQLSIGSERSPRPEHAELLPESFLQEEAYRPFRHNCSDRGGRQLPKPQRPRTKSQAARPSSAGSTPTWSSSRRLPGASRRAGQSIRWARATMIPSGPRTYAMRQMCSY